MSGGIETAREFLDSLPDGVFEADIEGTVRLANRALESMLGRPAGQLHGRSLADLCDRSQSGEIERLVVEVVARRSRQRFDSRLVHVDGSRLHVDGSIAPVCDDRGAVIALRGVLREFVHSKKAQSHLVEARDHALAAVRLKGQFVANMSHELRTPMNGIIGMTELALETEVTDEQREYLLAVRSSANSMLTLINDILDFSKLEAGRLTLEEIPFGLRDCLAESLKPLAVRAHQKGLELVYEIGSGVEETVVGDPSRLRQILINLVDNAIKFTERGEVAIRVELESRQGRDVHLRFDVIDTGIGIPPNQHGVIFESFAQADGTSTRKYGGTGLGLTISAQLAEMMGGRIWVESAPGRGSKFSFTVGFLLGEPSAGTHALAPSEALRGMRVLLADDNPMNLRTICRNLESVGMRVHPCDDGEQAWAALQQAAAERQAYDVALLDVQMPRIDGFELAARIQADPDLASTPLLLLTLAGQRGDAARCREIGAAGYLTKPLAAADLVESVQAVVGGVVDEAPVTLVTRHSLREYRERLRILVAEDNPINQKVARTLLEKQGHAVSVAADGQEALECIDENDFDLVIMDVQMPVVDGIEATRRIRSRETGRHLPILALTAHARPGDRKRFLAAGMDGYVSKPFRIEQLLTELERLVPGSAADAVATSRAHEPGLSAVSTEAAVDRDALLVLAGGDEELVAEVVRMFVDEHPVLLTPLAQALADEDLDLAARLSHKLKGTFRALAAAPASDAAQRLEQAADARDMDEAREAFTALERSAAGVERALVAWIGDPA